MQYEYDCTVIGVITFTDDCPAEKLQSVPERCSQSYCHREFHVIDRTRYNMGSRRLMGQKAENIIRRLGSWQQGGNNHILQPNTSEEPCQTAEDNWFIKSVSHLESSIARDYPYNGGCDRNVEILDWNLPLKYIGIFEHTTTVLERNMYHILLLTSGVADFPLVFVSSQTNFPGCMAAKPLLVIRSVDSGLLLASNIACTGPSRGFLGHLKHKGNLMFSSVW